jgi:tetratricopeptide (TPR) repeat protein
METPVALCWLIIALSVVLCGPAEAENEETDAVATLEELAPITLTEGLPSPERMLGIGKSALPVTTDSEDARFFFNQGLRLLHCFWEFEAYRAFEEAARHDPALAMAYWGMGITLPYNSQEYEEHGKALLEKASQLAENASEREQLYVKAWLDGSREEDRQQAQAILVSGLERLVDRYPDDVDARLFLALELMDGYDAEDQPETGTIYAQQILGQLLITHPDHAGAHHYWIHAVEEARPERAVESADRLLELAPGSGHMTHMPGHIYSKIGNYRRAREIFLTAKAVDEAYMERNGLTPVDNWNYVHNLFYLVSDASESGRFREGLAWAEELQGIPVDPQRPHAGGNQTIFHQGRVPLVQFLLRFSAWGEAAEAATEELSDFELHDETSRWYLEGIARYARGMALLPDNPTAARYEWAQLDARVLRLSRFADSEEHLAAFRRRELELHSKELEGLILLAEGDTERALEVISEAAEEQWSELERADPARYSKPTHEILGDAYLAAGRPEEARGAFLRALDARPRSGHALTGIARSHAAAGERKVALKAYQTVLEVWDEADADRPEIVEARAFLAASEARTER